MFSRWHRQRLISLTFRLSPSQSCSHSPRSRAPPLSLVCSYPPLPLTLVHIPLARSRLSLSLVRIPLPLALSFAFPSRTPPRTLVRTLSLSLSFTFSSRARLSHSRSCSPSVRSPLNLVRIPLVSSLSHSRSHSPSQCRSHFPRVYPLSLSYVRIPLPLSLL